MRWSGLPWEGQEEEQRQKLGLGQEEERGLGQEEETGQLNSHDRRLDTTQGIR